MFVCISFKCVDDYLIIEELVLTFHASVVIFAMTASVDCFIPSYCFDILLIVSVPFTLYDESCLNLV